MIIDHPRTYDDDFVKNAYDDFKALYPEVTAEWGRLERDRMNFDPERLASVEALANEFIMSNFQYTERRAIYPFFFEMRGFAFRDK